MNRIVVIFLALTIGTSDATGERAPQQLPESAREARDIYGKVTSKAIYAPVPIYPYKARRQRLEGAGIFGLLLRPNGTVSAVAVLRSTGVTGLDIAAAQALIQWRFTPPKSRIKGVKVPLNFVL